jgi:hypothetical protein
MQRQIVKSKVLYNVHLKSIKMIHITSMELLQIGRAMCVL